MKTLIILIGTPRGNEIVWRSMYDHLMIPHQADLALCFEFQSDKSSSLYKKAKYVWEVTKYNNWEQYYTENNISGNWKEIYSWSENDGNCVGFSGLGESKKYGSGAILIAFRHYLLKNHLETIHNYDKIILTRSDYFYAFDSPILDNEYYWVPEGESYGGIIDRFQQFPSKYSEQALNVMSYVCSDQIIKDFVYTGKLINIERVIARYFHQINFLDKVRFFDRSNFLVIAENDSSTGTLNNSRVLRGGKWKLIGFEDMYIKYMDEWLATQQNLFIHKVASKYKNLVK